MVCQVSSFLFLDWSVWKKWIVSILLARLCVCSIMLCSWGSLGRVQFTMYLVRIVVLPITVRTLIPCSVANWIPFHIAIHAWLLEVMLILQVRFKTLFLQGRWGPPLHLPPLKSSELLQKTSLCLDLINGFQWSQLLKELVLRCLILMGISDLNCLSNLSYHVQIYFCHKCLFEYFWTPFQDKNHCFWQSA